MEQKPVAKVVNGNVRWLVNNWPDVTELFTADQLKAEREKAIRECINIAIKFENAEYGEYVDSGSNGANCVKRGIEALLSTNESK